MARYTKVSENAEFIIKLNQFIQRFFFTQKVPFSLFRMLPEEEHDNHKSKWLIIDNLSIDGFNTPLALTCIPTGSANGSVMLLIFNKGKNCDISMPNAK